MRRGVPSTPGAWHHCTGPPGWGTRRSPSACYPAGVRTQITVRGVNSCCNKAMLRMIVRVEGNPRIPQPRIPVHFDAGLGLLLCLVGVNRLSGFKCSRSIELFLICFFHLNVSPAEINELKNGWIKPWYFTNKRGKFVTNTHHGRLADVQFVTMYYF